MYYVRIGITSIANLSLQDAFKREREIHVFFLTQSWQTAYMYAIDFYLAYTTSMRTFRISVDISPEKRGTSESHNTQLELFSYKQLIVSKTQDIPNLYFLFDTLH